MKKVLIAVAALAVLPATTAQAQTPLQPGGFYIAAEGGANWMFNTSPTSTFTFAGPSSFGSSPATRTDLQPVRWVARSATTSSAFASRPKASIGKTNGHAGGRWVHARASTSTKSRSWGMSTMTSSPDSSIVPYIGAGAGVAFLDGALGATGRARSSPIRASSAWAGTSTGCCASTWKAVTSARRLPTSTTGRHASTTYSRTTSAPC